MIFAVLCLFQTLSVKGNPVYSGADTFKKTEILSSISHIEEATVSIDLDYTYDSPFSAIIESVEETEDKDDKDSDDEVLGFVLSNELKSCFSFSQIYYVENLPKKVYSDALFHPIYMLFHSWKSFLIS